MLCETGYLFVATRVFAAVSVFTGPACACEDPICVKGSALSCLELVSALYKSQGSLRSVSYFSQCPSLRLPCFSPESFDECLEAETMSVEIGITGLHYVDLKPVRHSVKGE